MGLELLEERYQKFIAEKPECLSSLRKLADQNSLIQLDMRALLDGITARICPTCAASCCQCMPVDGWFTEGDYFIFRAVHAAPFNLRVDHGLPNGCSFLGSTGCVLPPESRPFPCVKVNCKAVSAELERTNAQRTFMKLYDALDELQEQLWYLIHPQTTQHRSSKGNAA